MKFSDGGTLSPDDIQARIGKLTASRMADAMDFLRNGNESAARRDYKINLVAERMTDIMTSNFVTSAMLWGIEQESVAKKAYREITGREIRPSGTLDHPEIEYFAATPDGFVEDGLIEIKCPATSTFIKWLAEGGVPEKHKPQMLAQMSVTGKPWVDFCAFDPRMPVGRQVFIRRFMRDEAMIQGVEKSAIQFLSEVDEIFAQVTTASMT
jgi:predicted phage-related endonuclease